MISCILIANRGEIACRIIRACRRLGIRAVAVYSDADARAPHVRMADEAIHIGPTPARDSYLAIERIIGAARRAGADAIHPGYGFLAENAGFAQACADAGLLFIGPEPQVIAALGNKRAARELAERAGVPVLPGYGGADQSDAALRRAAEDLGWPLMVKAAAGGGGQGMRLIERAADLSAALAAARHAGQAFGSDELILERALAAPRHVEVQIFGDSHGGLIHLGERDCSIQRRHQKVIEETPAPTLAPELRAALAAAAVAIGRAAGYTSAGTVEFLVDGERDFYFLEINTRLQVEHPVTELVTGLDLVEWQILVAEGRPLPLRQEQVRFAGHAIEARLYAEDPSKDFLPAAGEILLWRAPGCDGVRTDDGIQAGDLVGVAYDPLLAKVVAHGADRATAIRRLARALETTALLGVQTNQALLRAILEHPAFEAGAARTTFLAEHFAGWPAPADDLPLVLIAASLAQWAAQPNPTGRHWRNNLGPPQVYRYQAASLAEPIEVRLAPTRQDTSFRAGLGQEPDVTVEQNELSRPTASLSEEHEDRIVYDLTLTVGGHRRSVALAQAGDTWWVQTRRGAMRLQALPQLPAPASPADAGGSLRAPMPGKVLAVLVQVGQRVAKGEALLRLEAMKMEHTIRTAADGVVAALPFAPGDTVEADALLVQIQEDRSDPKR